MTTFKIKRKYLIGLGNWLVSIPLNGKQTRARVRFVNELQDAQSRIEKERLALLNELCEKDEEGKPKLIKDEETGKENFDLSEENTKNFSDQLREAYEEDAEITGPELAPSIVIMRDVVLNYEGDIDPDIAFDYDQWCAAFEAYTFAPE